MDKHCRMETETLKDSGSVAGTGFRVTDLREVLKDPGSVAGTGFRVTDLGEALKQVQGASIFRARVFSGRG